METLIVEITTVIIILEMEMAAEMLAQTVGTAMVMISLVNRRHLLLPPEIQTPQLLQLFLWRLLAL